MDEISSSDNLRLIANLPKQAPFDTTGAFGICLQQLASAPPAAGWIDDPNTCSATSTDPWKGVTGTAQDVATAAQGASGMATFVWGVAPRNDQPPGTYRATVLFEAISPNL